MTALPLAGRRVVITRAADQVAPLAQRLVAVGAEPITMPLIEIIDPSDGGVALRAALARLSDFDWLVVTSPNGAEHVGPAVAALGERRPLLAAVGTSTAAALGVPADLVPQHQITDGLLAEFPHGIGRVLVAQAESAGIALAEGLRARGWTVEVVDAYRTIATSTSRASNSALLLAVLAADAVLFASGSAVRAWSDVFGDATPPVVIAIGPATAKVAQGLGLKVSAISADHSLDGLVACLQDYLLGHG